MSLCWIFERQRHSALRTPLAHQGLMLPGLCTAPQGRRKGVWKELVVKAQAVVDAQKHMPGVVNTSEHRKQTSECFILFSDEGKQLFFL